MKTKKIKLFTSFLLLLLLCVALLGHRCKKDEHKNIGKVVFDTDIQAMLNCGPFEVDVYIKNIYVGSISEASGQKDIMPECFNTSSTLLVEKEAGTYDYYAECNCGTYGYWNGKLKIKSDSCIHVFLDFNNCSVKND